MADIREALLALAADWERHAPDRIVGQAVAADLRALAEFDVTPRGVHNHDIDPACPETRLPDGSLRGECTTNASPPTVKPSVEDLTRAMHAEVCCPCDPAGCDVQYVPETGYARAVLDLFPGRTEAEVYREGYDQGLRDAASVSRSEAEVKAEAWDEGWDASVDAAERCTVAGGVGPCGRCAVCDPPNPYRAARIEKKETT